MTNSAIKSRIEQQLADERPLAIWRMPRQSRVNGLFQKNNEDYRFAKTGTSGFIASDLLQSLRFLIPDDQADALSFPADTLVDHIKTDITKKPTQPMADKEHYFQMIAQAVQELKDSALEKIVLSHQVKVSSDRSVFDVLGQLLAHYPNAFVYLWYHPQTGIWLGATPETLIDVKNGQLTTMALAGTQTADSIDQVQWQAKEIQEQQYVVDAMTESLNRYTSGLQVSERKTVQAGKLYHLQTDLKAKLRNDELLPLLEDLHPTPAVCGIPRQKARESIRRYENYERGLYTGYLGYIKAENDRLETQLQVNLRCMQKNRDGYTLYVGGGITVDSHPQQEWEETMAKAQTMLKAL